MLFATETLPGRAPDREANSYKGVANNVEGTSLSFSL